MARINNLTNFLTDVASAIKTKKGDSTSIVASNFDTEILNLPSGGGTIEAEEKDVNFHDYDGTRVYSYTKSEFANLESMPTNPTHEGLVAMGWNWTLADAKTYVNKYGYLIIGQNYKTTNDETRLYIDIDENTLSPSIGFSLNRSGTATIDWGDNTTESVSVGTTISYFSHTYSQKGSYVIKVTHNAIYIKLSGSSSYNSYIIYNSSWDAYKRDLYDMILKKVELPEYVDFNNATFYKLRNLETISMPTLEGITSSIPTSCFQYCEKLKFVCFGNYVTQINSNCFRNSGVEYVAVGKSCPNIAQNVFQECMRLKRFSIPDGATQIYNQMFAKTYSMKKYVFPSSLTKINTACFQTSGALIYDFSNAESIPTLNISSYEEVRTDAIIVVPDSLYETWVTTTGWSSITQTIKKASEM